LEWLDLMHERGVLRYIDAVGLHGFPGASEFLWRGWDAEIAVMREQLERLQAPAELWITQTGFSTWRGEERAQVQAFVDAVHAPVNRIYWQSARDREPGLSNGDSYHSDERQYHYGLKRVEGSPKLLFRLWAEEGLDGVDAAVRARPKLRTGGRASGHSLITGGAGFIGSNLANRLARQGKPVRIYDDLSRSGSERNLEWLREEHGELIQVQVADVRNREGLRTAVREADRVFHFAAQVAVTTSLNDPVQDFEVNVGGTLNLLEEIRRRAPPRRCFLPPPTKCTVACRTCCWRRLARAISQ
jgi:CDP-paratose 2-epimerase